MSERKKQIIVIILGSLMYIICIWAIINVDKTEPIFTRWIEKHTHPTVVWGMPE